MVIFCKGSVTELDHHPPSWRFILARSDLVQGLHRFRDKGIRARKGEIRVMLTVYFVSLLMFLAGDPTEVALNTFSLSFGPTYWRQEFCD